MDSYSSPLEPELLRGKKRIVFKKTLLDMFTKEILSISPHKAFGYFLSYSQDGPVEEYIIFKENIRDEYNDLFKNGGNYYVTNKTGFVSTPEETFQAERYIQKKGLVKVGVFHNHRRHPAFLASIDAELHPDKNLWHLIISVRNPLIPRIKIFSIANEDVEELPFISSVDKISLIISKKRVIFSKKESQLRYETYIKPHMKLLQPVEFNMGFHPGESYKYCGEEPLHTVSLSPFYISDITVTQKLYKLYNPKYEIKGNPDLPATNVSWYDAVMFARWSNCRLPTEAEWEYACRAGSTGNWCCDKEEDLVNYGWYSENSKGRMHPVASLQPNAFGLYDMHGNVWEWCQDSYEADYYRKSKKINPVNKKRGLNKVCRGGSLHAFGSMCRSALRNSEPAYYYASDIGFRLVKDVERY